MSWHKWVWPFQYLRHQCQMYQHSRIIQVSVSTRIQWRRPFVLWKLVLLILVVVLSISSAGITCVSFIIIVSVSMSACGMPEILMPQEGFLYFMPFCGMPCDAEECFHLYSYEMLASSYFNLLLWSCHRTVASSAASLKSFIRLHIALLCICCPHILLRLLETWLMLLAPNCFFSAYLWNFVSVYYSYLLAVFLYVNEWLQVSHTFSLT